MIGFYLLGERFVDNRVALFALQLLGDEAKRNSKMSNNVECHCICKYT